MAKTSHRISFERWLRSYGQYSVREVCEQRAELGYEREDWDLAFQAYKQAISVERGRQHDRISKKSPTCLRCGAESAWIENR